MLSNQCACLPGCRQTRWAEPACSISNRWPRSPRKRLKAASCTSGGGGGNSATHKQGRDGMRLRQHAHWPRDSGPAWEWNCSKQTAGGKMLLHAPRDGMSTHHTHLPRQHAPRSLPGRRRSRAARPVPAAPRCGTEQRVRHCLAWTGSARTPPPAARWGPARIHEWGGATGMSAGTRAVYAGRRHEEARESPARGAGAAWEGTHGAETGPRVVNLRAQMHSRRYTTTVHAQA